MADLGDGLLSAYVGLARLAGPIGRGILLARRRAGKEDPERWRERLGAPAGGPSGGRPVVWVHAASVGESVAVRPLVERLVAGGAEVVMTTVTVTSAGVVGRWPSAHLHHRFVPVDLPGAVDAFLDLWRPGLAVFVESEVWPVTIHRLHRRAVPLVVCNGRMSPRSFAGWSRFPSASRALFRRIRLCLAQSEGDAERFRRLGVPEVEAVGNIKFDAPVPEAPAAAAEALAAAVGGRRLLLAASTHPGEEPAVLDAARRLAARHPDLLTVVAPRHPERGGAIAEAAAAEGWPVRRRSLGELPDAATRLYVADSVGELGTFYRLASAAFVGGSLVPVGGHNPIEPARLGAPVATGPLVDNFREVYDAFAAAGAVDVVADGAELAAAVDRLLSEPEHRSARVAAATRLIGRYTGALERSIARIAPLLPRAADGGRGEG